MLYYTILYYTILLDYTIRHPQHVRPGGLLRGAPRRDPGAGAEAAAEVSSAQ